MEQEVAVLDDGVAIGKPIFGLQSTDPTSLGARSKSIEESILECRTAAQLFPLLTTSQNKSNTNPIESFSEKTFKDFLEKGNFAEVCSLSTHPQTDKNKLRDLALSACRFTYTESKNSDLLCNRAVGLYIISLAQDSIEDREQLKRNFRDLASNVCVSMFNRNHQISRELSTIFQFTPRELGDERPDSTGLLIQTIPSIIKAQDSERMSALRYIYGAAFTERVNISSVRSVIDEAIRNCTAKTPRALIDCFSFVHHTTDIDVHDLFSRYMDWFSLPGRDLLDNFYNKMYGKLLSAQFYRRFPRLHP